MAEKQSAPDGKLALILQAAAKVFAEKGYHQATIRDISRTTGISLSGLYYYFDSKQELLYLIQDHGFGTVLRDLNAALDGIEDPIERLRVLIEKHLRFFGENMDQMKVLSHEADSLSGDYRHIVNAKKKRYAQICTAILRELHPERDPLDLRVATFSLFGMMNWIYNWYRPGRDVPVGELANQMSRLFLEGFGSSRFVTV